MNKVAQLQTRESFLYGRFETMMRPAYGSGIVSSFFMFYDGLDFKNNWNEIDFEFLGRHTNSLDTNVIRSSNGYADTNVNVKHHTLNKRSSDNYWKLCIEWTPTEVIWKVDDVIIRTLIVQLKNRQKLMMNIWIGNPAWAGEFNEGLIPAKAEYLYVRYSAFEKGKFVFKWQDEFNALDNKRWYAANQSLYNTMLIEENVVFQDSKLYLNLTK